MGDRITCPDGKDTTAALKIQLHDSCCLGSDADNIALQSRQYSNSKHLPAIILSAQHSHLLANQIMSLEAFDYYYLLANI